jgi:nitrite reductase/ring-hydroxylating ferredoxin subunit
MSDGPALSELVNAERREVSNLVYADPEVYQLELERVFARAWVVLGHDSEVPAPGDFVTRMFGEDPVIVARREDGTISCLLNVCPHRGALVAREDDGNANVFRCIYHGWRFDLGGAFRGAPWNDAMFPDGCEAGDMGLRAARVEVFAGIIFACWDESAPPLEQFLGDMGYYLQMIFNRTKDGFEVLGPPQRWIIPANWKVVSEQFAGDVYHASQLHRSAGMATGGNRANPSDWQMDAPMISSSNGHGLLFFNAAALWAKMTGGQPLSAEQMLQILPPPGVPREKLGELKERFTSEELDFLALTPPSIGGIFPNSACWSMNAPLADGNMASFVSIRTFVPSGPEKFEFCMWVLVPKGCSEEYRELARRSTSFTQGAAGFIEGDDGEVWPGVTSAAKGYITRQTTTQYRARTGHNPPDQWPGPGNVHIGFCRDDAQWNWWEAYFNHLNQKS